MGSCSGDNDDQDGNGTDYDDNEDDDGSYKQLYLQKNSLLVGLGVSGGAEAGRTKSGGSRHFLPTSETLLCFKVKVNMMTKPTNKQNICKQTVSGLACRPLPLRYTDEDDTDVDGDHYDPAKKYSKRLSQAWLAALSPSVSLLLSPVTIAVCRFLLNTQ